MDDKLPPPKPKFNDAMAPKNCVLCDKPLMFAPFTEEYCSRLCWARHHGAEHDD